MRFALLCHDRPGQLELRMATRPSHLDYLNGIVGTIVQGGPLLDAEGKPCGSLFVIDAPDRAAAEAFAAGDPYAKAGLFADSTLSAYRTVFEAGAQVA